ncbi:MAG: TIGR00725 family protein [Chlorobi bacterium]|nr:TIGR00725 family protein [Chlorobiota bacterium]
MSVAGPNTEGCSEELYAFGMELGAFLARHGYTIINGGRGGWMEAVFRGAKTSPHYRPGMNVCILPSAFADEANPYCDVPIPTGLGLARNFLVANASPVLIAAGGGAGTLSEIAFAWQTGKRILAFTGFGGWAARLAGTRLDHRRDEPVIPVSSLDELARYL